MKAMKKIEKEFELVNNIIERHWNRAIGLVNAEGPEFQRLVAGVQRGM